MCNPLTMQLMAALQNRLNQQTKMAEGNDSDHVEEEPQGVDSYLTLDIALVGDTNIQQALSRHGVHHHYLDGSLHFEHGILSIQKNIHTCHHAFFKVFPRQARARSLLRLSRAFIRAR